MHHSVWFLVDGSGLPNTTVRLRMYGAMSDTKASFAEYVQTVKLSIIPFSSQIVEEITAVVVLGTD